MSGARASAIVYDMGNVLVEIDFDRVVATWARHAGIPVETLKPRFSHASPAYQAHERGEIDVARYFDALRHELGVDLADAALAEGWDAVFGEPIAPTIELVHRLAPIVPQYVFSNTNAAHHASWRERYRGALAPIERHFLSHEMGLRKPEPAAFEKLARDIGVTPGEILFLDDLPVNVDAARSVGMEAVLVRSTEDVARAVKPWLGGVPTAS